MNTIYRMFRVLDKRLHSLENIEDLRFGLPMPQNGVSIGNDNCRLSSFTFLL